MPDPLPPYIRMALSNQPGVFRQVRHMVRCLLANARGEKQVAFTWGKAEGFTLDGEALTNDIARAAIYYAMRYPEYWGVKNAQAFSYCTHCRQVKRREEFPDKAARCQSCKDRAEVK